MYMLRRLFQHLAILALTTTYLSVCQHAWANPDKPYQSRDRHLDSLAGTIVLSPPFDNLNYPKALEQNIKGLERDGEFVQARGVAATLVEELNANPTANEQQKAEAEKTLLRLDKLARQQPTEKLQKVVDNSPFMLGTARMGIGYAYEIFTRAETPTEQIKTELKLCVLLADYIEKEANTADSDLYGNATRYCIDTIHRITDARDFKFLSSIDRILTVLRYMKPKNVGTQAEYLDNLLSINDLDPVVADRAYGQTATYIQFYIGSYDFDRSFAAKSKTMLSNVNLLLALAKRLNNQKEIGTALYYRGGLYERSGELNYAANDYAKAYVHLSGAGYLQIASDMQEKLEKNLEFSRHGGPEAVARKAKKVALKEKDFAAAARADNALANILSRQHRLKDRKEVLLSMLSNATAAKSKALMARALYLMGQESFLRSETPLSKHDQLMKSAELYREIGDVDGEAMVLLKQVTTELRNMEIRESALRLAQESGSPYRQAVLYQLDSLTKQAQKDYKGARISAEKCRDLYASIRAKEQVAHCEVLLAEIAQSEDDKDAGCAHLVKARDLFSELGFPSRVIQQENKMNDRMCTA
jgi:hypothetical protein